MKITIPSYRRPEIIRKKTLALLERLKISPKNVTVFLASEEEVLDYKMNLHQRWWGSLLNCRQQGLMATRNFIATYFPEGTEMVGMDDDLSEIIIRNPKATMRTPRRKQGSYVTPQQFRELVRVGFRQCREHGARLWGVCATDNPMHMFNRTYLGLSYFPAAFYGNIVSHDRSLLVHQSVMEEYERSMRYYLADRCLVKLENYGIRTTYYGGLGGGLQADGLEARMAKLPAAAAYLLKTFPSLCAQRERRGHIDIKMKRIPYSPLL